MMKVLKFHPKEVLESVISRVIRVLSLKRVKLSKNINKVSMIAK
jgi:hypothetical protein